MNAGIEPGDTLEFWQHVSDKETLQQWLTLSKFLAIAHSRS